MKYYERIKMLRLEQGLTQEQLAHKVGYKDKTAVNKVENGLRDIPQSKICAFADALGVSASYLMDGSPSEDFVEMEYTHDEKYPIDLKVSRGEYRLILELRERGEIDQSTLEEMFNTILAYKQENGLKLTDSTNKHMKFKITVKEFLNGEQ